MTPQRQYVATLALLAAGGVLGLTAASRPWGTVQLASSLSQSTETTVAGSDLLPLAPAVSLVSMAAVVAVPAVRRVGRRVVGAVLAVLGASLAVMAVLTLADLSSRVQTWASDSPGLSGTPDTVSTSPAWAVLLTCAGLIIVVAGVLVLVRGPGWPSMGSRYDRPAGPQRSTRPGADDDRSGDDQADPRQTWDALDRGDDPT